MSQERAEPDPNRWRVLPVCLAVGFITTLDVSIVNVALPSIESSLDAGPTELQLVVAGYTLAFGLALVPAGRLGDAGARRALFIAGLVGFALMSLACGLAPTDTWLGVARLLQGVSAGVLNPQVVGLIQQEFRGYERGRAFGMFGATIGVSTALRPLLGGLIIAAAGPETDGAGCSSSTSPSSPCSCRSRGVSCPGRRAPARALRAGRAGSTSSGSACSAPRPSA